MSSDEDYMSEEFLAKCLPEKDVAPGLIKGYSAKRQHKLDKKKEECKKMRPLPKKILENNRREEGLQASITSDNKGFAMLQKMGYQPGKGIGKEKSGIAEPIAITVKNNRFGLGRESALKEISEWKAKKREERLQSKTQVGDIEDYRKRFAMKSQDRYIKRDISTSQNVCKRLDMDNDILNPDEKWFWPEEEKLSDEDKSNSEEEEEVYLEPWEKLKYLTSYLRLSYNYCIWCGIKYESHQDLLSNCPGSTRDDH